MSHLHMYLDAKLSELVKIESVAAVSVNLYDSGNHYWSLEVVGTSDFDEINSDWACEEIYTSRNEPFSWHQMENWETILDTIVLELENYLNFGSYAKELKTYKAVATGFVDGDLTIVYQK